MQKTLSLTVVFAILAWTMNMNVARAGCQMPINPDENNRIWYYNCVQDEQIRTQYQIQQQEQRLRELEAQQGVLPGFR